MAEKSGQAESNVRKVVRAAIAQRIFEEPQPGVIRHSAASRLLAEDPGIHDYVATVSDELWPAAAQTCNAWAKFPGSEEPNETVNQLFLLVLSWFPTHEQRGSIHSPASGHTLTSIGLFFGE